MSAEKTRRWLALMECLPSEPPGYTVDRLCQRLAEVDGIEGRHRRTVQRDLVEMENSGLFDLERGSDPSSGADVWYMARGPFGHSRITPLSATTLKLSIEHLRGVLPPAAYDSLLEYREIADRVLARRNIGEPGTRRWEDKVRIVPPGYATRPPAVDESILNEVYGALAADRRLRATYERPDGQLSEREYHPLALIVRPPKFQLLVHSGKGPYVLNIHRIRKAERLDLRVWVPDGWDLDAWLREGHHDVLVGDRCQLNICCDVGLALYFRDNPLADDQVIGAADQDAAVEVQATVVDTMALRRFLLSLGDQLQVRKPTVIRDWLSTEVNRMAQRYAGNTRHPNASSAQ